MFSKLAFKKFQLPPAPVSAAQFAIFRIVIGFYLAVHFVRLISVGTELFSREGMFPRTKMTVGNNFFPNILDLFDSPQAIKASLIFMACCSLCIMMGVLRRLLSVVLWYSLACLLNRNFFILNPSIPLLGWVLLAVAAIPSGEPYGLSPRNKNWNMPPEIFWGAWVVLAVSYTLSGLDKLHSPSWLNGTALNFILQSPLARDNFVSQAILSSSPLVVKFLTYFSLATEVFFLPLAYFRRTRPLAWFSVLLLHLGILLNVNFADLTLGVLVAHLFIFDWRWWPTAPMIKT